MNSGLLVLRSGERSIRLRPVLDVKDEIVESSLRIMHDKCRKLEKMIMQNVRIKKKNNARLKKEFHTQC